MTPLAQATNGRLKITWGQFVWGAMVIFLLGGAEVQLVVLSADLKELKKHIGASVYSKETIDHMYASCVREQAIMWETIKDLKEEVKRGR